MRFTKPLTALAVTLFFLTGAIPAKAYTSKIECLDTSDSNYLCASVYGYNGVDDGYTRRRTAVTEIFIHDSATNNLNPDWPDHFITFPKDPSGGGTGPVALNVNGPTP
jgi:hypothetical protein